MPTNNRSGFTVVEILIVMIIVGVMAAIAIPRLRGSTEKQGVRSSRAAVQTLVAKARGAAIQRGCPSTLHFVTGRVWVTVCRIRTTGGTLDTLGAVENLAARYAVAMTSSIDSLRFDPRGINATYQTVSVRFTAGAITDSVNVNAVGKVVH